ncbi:MAG: hypothetical protein IIZ39_14135 [Blautia sp.]|nr:hypothetical protein [Blautia sp.]
MAYKSQRQKTKTFRELIDESPYKEQLYLMLNKGSPLEMVMACKQEYESSRTLTDADLVALDRLLRKPKITDEEYDELAGLFMGKCLISAYYPEKAIPGDKTTKTLQVNGILETFINIDDTYSFIQKYYPPNDSPQGIRVINFDSIIEQAELLGTIAVLGWHVGDDSDPGRMSFYYDGRKEEFHRGCVLLHKTEEELKRYQAMKSMMEG